MGEAAGRSARGDGRGAMSLTGQDLNELCSENYLDGLAGASVSELRSLRDACQRAEAVLSYLRRVIQGNIDLVVAESKVRQDGGHSDLGRLVDELPSILASSGPLAEDTDHVSVRSIKAVTQILDLQHDLALEALVPSPRRGADKLGVARWVVARRQSLHVRGRGSPCEPRTPSGAGGHPVEEASDPPRPHRRDPGRHCRALQVRRCRPRHPAVLKAAGTR